ncbi:hypothetical protein PPERSA_07594 [Pseudocohnilembus persalinus]|uniref:Uncharacterized protein n=1 Tax=Pseudocohnilembus persalinus TaxID=266149 RepID=A0A0V0QI93_PSEPJ|nr:hypothetical protein PPERSA_07594 [Pseudocohnilembus persalinus]|eukprot:KRX01949.1 hypothetical protein PPERSA_07594 [Pseudocohnilembus persalinus]
MSKNNIDYKLQDKQIDSDIRSYKFIYCKKDKMHNLDALNSVFMSTKFPEATKIQPACAVCIEEEFGNPKFDSYGLKKCLLELAKQNRETQKDKKQAQKMFELKEKVDKSLNGLEEIADKFHKIAINCEQISKNIKKKIVQLNDMKQEGLKIDKLQELKDRRENLLKDVLQAQKREELEEKLQKLGDETVLIQKNLEWKKQSLKATLVNTAFPYEIMSFKNLVQVDLKKWEQEIETRLNFVKNWDVKQKSLVQDNQEYLNAMKMENRIEDTSNLNRETFTQWNYQRLIDMKESMENYCQGKCGKDFSNLEEYEFREDPPKAEGYKQNGCEICDDIINRANQETFQVLLKNKKDKLKW